MVADKHRIHIGAAIDVASVTAIRFDDKDVVTNLRLVARLHIMHSATEGWCQVDEDLCRGQVHRCLRLCSDGVAFGEHFELISRVDAEASCVERDVEGSLVVRCALQPYAVRARMVSDAVRPQARGTGSALKRKPRATCRSEDVVPGTEGGSSK